MIDRSGTVVVLLNMVQYPSYVRAFANAGFYVAPVPFFFKNRKKGPPMAFGLRPHPPVRTRNHSACTVRRGCSRSRRPDVAQETLQPVMVAVRDPTNHKADFDFAVGIDPGTYPREPLTSMKMHNVQEFQVRTAAAHNDCGTGLPGQVVPPQA